MEPREIADALRYIDQRESGVDKYGHIRAATLEHREIHGCDAHPTSPHNARMHSAIARLLRARRVLELGCALGYSALWLAEALPEDGILETIEHDETHVALAEENFHREGGAKKIRVIAGEALAIMPTLTGPYDLIFLDFYWEVYPRLFPDLLRLLRPGGALISSNIFPGTFAPDVGDLDKVAEYRWLLETDSRLFTVYLFEDNALSIRLE